MTSRESHLTCYSPQIKFNAVILVTTSPFPVEFEIQIRLSTPYASALGLVFVSPRLRHLLKVIQYRSLSCTLSLPGYYLPSSRAIAVVETTKIKKP